MSRHADFFSFLIWCWPRRQTGRSKNRTPVRRCVARLFPQDQSGLVAWTGLLAGRRLHTALYRRLLSGEQPCRKPPAVPHSLQSPTTSLYPTHSATPGRLHHRSRSVRRAPVTRSSGTFVAWRGPSVLHLPSLECTGSGAGLDTELRIPEAGKPSTALSRDVPGHVV